MTKTGRDFVLIATRIACIACMTLGFAIGFMDGKHAADRWWQAQQKEYGIVPKIEFVPNPHLSSVCRVEWKSKRTGKTGHGDWISCSDAQSWLHSDQEIEMTIVEKPLWVTTGEPKDAK